MIECDKSINSENNDNSIHDIKLKDGLIKIIRIIFNSFEYIIKEELNNIDEYYKNANYEIIIYQAFSLIIRCMSSPPLQQEFYSVAKNLVFFKIFPFLTLDLGETELFKESPDVTPQAGLDERLVQLLAQEVTPQTRFVVTPETFTYDVDIDNPLLSSPSLRTYAAFLSAHPGTDLLLGALTYRRFFNTYAKPSRSARPGGAGQWVDVYNTALVMDSQQVYGSYVKSKLVPGVEIIPYENVLKFLGPIVQKFGGSSSSYGTQDEMDAIPTSDGSKLGAMICYESVYGDWSRVATKKGARFLAVMTNDGWWGDTPGYRQHFNFARLRAIENRRDVVQAANTGTSGFINQRGDVLAKTGWWVETTLKGTINGNDALTPFVRHGDRVGRCAGYLFLASLLTLLVFAVSGRRSGRGKSASGKS